ncbi:SHOCT domain-containing protein [Streptomyces yangpuensis]|uniref:SHOCT domain-containing protein n=1 Tax=Streptomyces yangpuensis TaxID=1648182 RepID=UPI0038085022
MGLGRHVVRHAPAHGSGRRWSRCAPPQRRSVPPGPAQPPAAPSAKQVLAERFARGEIDEEEYEQRLTVLRAHGPTQGRSGSGET